MIILRLCPAHPSNLFNRVIKILLQVHAPNEYQLGEVSIEHPLYWTWSVPNVKMRDLDLKIREFRKEHARFDIFINGQFILERDYETEQKNNDFLVKFIRANFPFNLESSDDIKIEGDIELV